ncbi:MAG: transporter [Rhizobiaceae bacterium]
MTYLPLILFTVLSNAAAQLMLKQGMLTFGPITTGDGPMTVMSIITIIFKVAFHPWVFFGLCAFVISMMSHLYVLSKVELSFVYPFLSIAFVAVAVGSWLFFGEDINGWRILGFGFICVGTILVAQSATETTVTASKNSTSDSVFIESNKT